jgi:hypothetical protein
MKAPLAIVNLTQATITVLGVDLEPQVPKELSSEETIPWVRDAWLRFNVEDGRVQVVLYGVKLDTEVASRWLSRISTGDIVVS